MTLLYGGSGLVPQAPLLHHLSGNVKAWKHMKLPSEANPDGPTLTDLELHLANASTSTSTSTSAEALSSARASLRAWLYQRLGEAKPSGSIGEAIEQLAANPKKHIGAAIVVLRTMSVPGLLPSGDKSNNVSRYIVSLCEEAVPDLCSFAGVKPRDQNYKKMASLAHLHDKVCDIIVPLRNDYSTLSAVNSAKRSILGALNHGQVKRYCGPFGLSNLRGAVDAVLLRVGRVIDLEPSLTIDVDECRRAIGDARQLSREHLSFLTRDFLDVFLDNVERTLSEFLDSARSKFSTRIGLGSSGSELVKRYPLYEEDRELQVLVPLRNSGPGLATDVRISVENESQCKLLSNEVVSLGNVAPGEFSVAIDVLVVKPCASFTALIQVEWGELGDTERKSELVEIKVISQRSDIDWDKLEYAHPYSTAPAKGKSFVGRSEQVKTLVSRLLRRPMEPTFITGQKRVGKTSLALAAMEAASTNDPDQRLSHHYILWGHVAHEDPRDSIRDLGRQIEEFILNSLGNPSYVEGKYDGSLAPLVKLSRYAIRIENNRRFVIVIDEFDEIPQELYLSGNLAETLFANLRALTTTDNICIILVGGENMPFVMERQGQKLNKYHSLNVTYFSRKSEWQDYTLMISKPTEESIMWHGDAITELYNVTHGNPYFTKVICNEVFLRAVTERDADVTAVEVRRAMDAQVPGLDANLFAHLWQDGIPRPVSDREPIVLQRSRVLVALARCYRRSLKADLTAISENCGGLPISQTEIAAVLNDFVRRRVLEEVEDGYQPVLPIFKKWLVEVGVSRLIADAVTEELAAAAHAAEDEAFVTSAETVALANKWPTYRGKHVGSDDIRNWLLQVPTNREQRLLFKVLSLIRFVREEEIREKLKSAHGLVRGYLSTFIKRSLSDRRKDVVITYIDGQGKSGQSFASSYAEENRLWTGGIMSPSDFTERYKNYTKDNGAASAVVVVDDIAATGRSLAGNIKNFLEANSEVFNEEGPALLVICLFATTEADQHIRRALAKNNYARVDFRAAEILGSEAFAFPEGPGSFTTTDEKDQAKALVRDLGSRIYKQHPLGYGDLGLTVVFPTTVPNNTLPIIHSFSKAGQEKWEPLFERVVN